MNKHSDIPMRNDTAKHIRSIRQALRNKIVPRKYDIGFWILTMLLIYAAFCTLEGCARAETIAGYDVNKWADSIKRAEGNSNYGILAHYRHTSYRQACINTVRHKYRLWCAVGHRGAFVGYLAGKYAPIGVSNDPNGLNVNWQRNVMYYLKRG